MHLWLFNLKSVCNHLIRQAAEDPLQALGPPLAEQGTKLVEFCHFKAWFRSSFSSFNACGPLQVRDSYLIIPAVTSTCTVRESLTRGQKGTSVFKAKFRMDVEVYDLYPGLTQDCARLTVVDSQHARRIGKRQSNAHPFCWSVPRKSCHNLCLVADAQVSRRDFSVSSRRETRSLTRPARPRETRSLTRLSNLSSEQFTVLTKTLQGCL